jgi:hypothetical protein
VYLLLHLFQVSHVQEYCTGTRYKVAENGTHALRAVECLGHGDEGEKALPDRSGDIYNPGYWRDGWKRATVARVWWTR